MCSGVAAHRLPPEAQAPFQVLLPLALMLEVLLHVLGEFPLVLLPQHALLLDLERELLLFRH
jgi:hypothetical protein